ncbi:Bifunctional aspartokinase/homoserine dehydrogenase 1 [Buchnera aphidicola (Cinara piceae)]|uniref:Bifunctional aspartokinase/homoserine dehydrogenase n=1 Tax=Buchnera aphidicola (Cinara piceae) TaxID=1660043 RepID=A0A803FTM0_9GAMM|nr:bifunctional aspartate kinase/homoserine dehydrogenase I [Buchnera aphidicola]VFP88131.1 Bifunctional aspartokinase/homoserine dehydrogenase 1 [Buchnera aphidicola (Cinara piceae)]
MKTLKFGGTSLANAKKFIQVSSIITNQIKNDQISVVLSAPASITNQLEYAIKKCIKKNKVPKKKLLIIKNFFFNLINNIYLLENRYPEKKVKTKIIIQYEKLNDTFYKIKSLKSCPDNIYAKIISTGEILSVQLMKELLKINRHKIITINPVKLISANNNYLNAVVDIKRSKKNFQKLNFSNINIILMPGFIAGNKKKEHVVLGRNGSDYSATILSICTNSHICEIWTDVNGIYTGDPNIISKAQLLSEITYQEALELAYLGAKVIHPASIEPLKKYNIPCVIKNTNNIQHPGTIINSKNKKNNEKIKGITHLNNIIQINIFILKNYNIEKISYKLLKYLYKNNISIYLYNQSISHNRINFYFQKHNLIAIKNKLKKIFNIEIQKKILKSVILLKKLSIISIIGNNIKNNNTEILKKVCSTIDNFNNKILFLSYNISNISLSIVLEDQKIIKIMEKIHNLIITKIIPINIFLIGIGGVGLELLKIIFMQREILKKKFIQINVNLIANSKKYIINKKNINSYKWIDQFKNSTKIFHLKHILELIKKNGYLIPILIDCTASQNIANQYNLIMKSGFHIITANKKSNSSQLSEYIKIRKTANKYNRKFFYETHVGAGLPIIQNLKNLIDSGDKLIKFQGILSGSMSYIFGELDNNITLSKATKKAKKLGFTEPNPKDDLTGIDVARKLLILAREFGYSLELADIKIEEILPNYLKDINNKKIFLSKLKKIDHLFIKKVKQAKKEKKVLRFIGTIKNNGKCSVQIKSVNNQNPLYHIKNGENIFVFHTKYYQPIPLILRGYGAGNNVTASGIFSDLLRIVL